MKYNQSFKKINNFYDEPLDLSQVKLVQVGRYHCAPGEIIEEHTHTNFFELTLVTDGSAIVITNDEKVTISKNDIYVSFPYDKHEMISSETDPIKYRNVAFEINGENSIYHSHLENIKTNFKSASLRIIHNSYISTLISLIFEEFEAKKSLYMNSCQNLILLIATYMIREFEYKDIPIKKYSTQNDILCTQIMNYIDTHIYEIKNLKNIEVIVNYNYSYLSDLFKQTTGMTLKEYFLNKRLEVANSLFKEGKLKIYQIAELLHYSDGNTLSKAYKKKYGVSPSEISKN